MKDKSYELLLIFPFSFLYWCILVIAINYLEGFWQAFIMIFFGLLLIGLKVYIIARFARHQKCKRETSLKL